jgi:hypothetical protein
MERIRYAALLTYTVSLFACQSADSSAEDEADAADEAVGHTEDAFCMFGSAPPAGFSPNVEVSLDGDADHAISDGYAGTGACDMYTVGVDTNPDRAEEVSIWMRTLGACDDADPSEQQAFVWKRQQAGSAYFWSRSVISLGNGFDQFGDCWWRGSHDVSGGNYTRLIVAAKGKNPNGTRAAPEIVVAEPPSGDFMDRNALGPTSCPVSNLPPTAIDATRTLAGAVDEVNYWGIQSAANCDFVTMKIDTDPDRAAGVAYTAYVPGSCDNLDWDSVEAYAWKRYGAGPLYSWTRERITFSIWASFFHNGHCGRAGGVSFPENNGYTQVVIGARGLTDAGAPVAEVELRAWE